MTTTAGFLGETLTVAREPGVTVQVTVGYLDHTPLDRLAVIFPPHPSLGGNAENNVVQALFRRAVAGGLLTAAVEYRGVRTGEVDGTHLLAYWDRLEAAGDFTPVIDDAVASIAAIEQSFRCRPHLDLVGYSFGSLVALSVARRLPVDGVAVISPPLFEYDFAPLLDVRPPARVWHAPADPFCPAGALESLGLAGLDLHAFPAADHFFRGAEEALAAAVLSPWLNRATSPSRGGPA